MNTTRVLLKISKWSPEPDQEAQRNFANVKSPFYKSTILKVLKKSVTSSPQTFPWKRHDMPHQTSTENDPQNIVTHRIWQSTIHHTYRHSPYLTKPQKVKSPPSTSPLFKTFSNIYLFPDLTILVLTILFRRRFRL